MSAELPRQQSDRRSRRFELSGCREFRRVKKFLLVACEEVRNLERPKVNGRLIRGCRLKFARYPGI